MIISCFIQFGGFLWCSKCARVNRHKLISLGPILSQQEGELLLAASAEVSKIVLDPRRPQNEICWQ